MAAGERIGWQAIEEGYKMYSSYPYYALFEKTGNTRTGRLLFPYKGTDRDGEGWRLLQENLRVVESTAPSAPLIIQFYEELGKSGRLDQSTPYAGSFPLRLQAYEGRGNMPAVGGIMPVENATFNNYLQQQLMAKDEEILNLKDEIRDLEAELEAAGSSAEPKAKIEGMIGTIGEAGNQFPWLADIIKDWSTVLKHKFGAGAGHRPPGAIAGVPGAAAAETAERPAAGTMPWNKRYEAARNQLMTWYAKTYGDLETEEGREKGCNQFANDMDLLARLCADDDMMLLALKKLRALE